MPARAALADLAVPEKPNRGVCMGKTIKLHGSQTDRHAVVVTVPAADSAAAPARFATRLQRGLAVLLCASMLASCATQLPKGVMPASQRQATLTALVAQQDRLYRVAAPLLVNNAGLCKNHARKLLGFTAKNQYSYSAELSEVAKAVLMLDERLQVMRVLQGSGAARAGVQRGDILQTVQNQPLPTGPTAETEAARLLANLVGKADTIELSVLRAGKSVSMKLPLTRACAFSVDVGNANHVNAYSDGRRILVTRGLLNYLQTDAELATILAREMAHNILQHQQAEQMTATLSDVIDRLLPLKPDSAGFAGSAGIKTMPAKLDQDADRLALYMLARAGYDITAAAPGLQKLARDVPQSLSNSYTALHPMTNERLALLQATVTEIKQKQAAGKAPQP